MRYSDARLAKQATFLKALADETRLKMVLLLLDGKKTVTEITNYSDRAQPTVSLNLKVLENAGVVYKEREGRHVYYFLKAHKVNGILKKLGLGKPEKTKHDGGEQS